MTNRTSTKVIFTGAWCNQMVAKQQDCHYTAPADNQINKDMIHTPNQPQILTMSTKQFYGSKVKKNQM